MITTVKKRASTTKELTIEDLNRILISRQNFQENLALTDIRYTLLFHMISIICNRNLSNTSPIPAMIGFQPTSNSLLLLDNYSKADEMSAYALDYWEIQRNHNRYIFIFKDLFYEDLQKLISHYRLRSSDLAMLLQPFTSIPDACPGLQERIDALKLMASYLCEVSHDDYVPCQMVITNTANHNWRDLFVQFTDPDILRMKYWTVDPMNFVISISQRFVRDVRAALTFL